MSYFAKILITTSLMMGLASCQKEGIQKEKSKSGEGSEMSGLAETLAARTITITDSLGKPMDRVQVMVGTAKDEPFKGNFLMTDQFGKVTFPSDWKSQQPITLNKEGYLRVTYLDQNPLGQKLKIKALPPVNLFELTGIGTDFSIKDGDKMMDFALMIPGMKKEDLLNFNIDMFISPQIDEIKVYGQVVKLPSNTSLPKQKENIAFFGVTLEKPLYRMYFETLGSKSITTILGSFPFAKVVNEMNTGSSFLNLINMFSLKGGHIQSVDITGPTQSMNFPVNTIIFDSQKNFKAPVLGYDDVLLAAALNKKQNEYYPTDFKNVASGASQALVTTKNGGQDLLVAVKRKSEEYLMGSAKLSAAFIPFVENQEPALLPLIENPEFDSDNRLKIKIPSVPAKMSEEGMSLTLSSVIKSGSGKDYKEIVFRKWQVYSSAWHSQVEIPIWPDDTPLENTKRWEVTLLASQDENRENIPVDFTDRLIETVTHATHSAIDF